MKIKQGVLEIQSIEQFSKYSPKLKKNFGETKMTQMTQMTHMTKVPKNLIRQGWVTFRTIVPGFNHRIQQFRRGAKQNKTIILMKNFFVISAGLVC